MYKVFFKNKSIVFSHLIEPVDRFDNMHVVISPDKNNISQIINSFLGTTKDDRLLILSEDHKGLKREFLKSYCPIIAAGGVVINNIGELLTIYRNSFWDLPKGKVDDDEGIPQCAVREVYEEAGVKAYIARQKPYITHHIYRAEEVDIIKHTHWYQMRSAVISNRDLVPQISEGIMDVKWANCDQFRSTMLHQCYPLIIDVLLNFDLTKFITKADK